MPTTAPSPAPARTGPTTATTIRTRATGRRRAGDGAAAADTGAAPSAAGTGTPDRSTTAKATRTGTGPAPDHAPAGQSGPAAHAAGSSDALVQAAFAHGHDLTVPEIAQTTGLGKSTVAKALNRLAAAGQATRTAGSGGGVTRTPDRWNLAAEIHPSTSTGTDTDTRTGTDTGSGASTGPAPTAATHDRTKAPRAARSPAARNQKRAAATGHTKTSARGASAPAKPTAPAQPTAVAGAGTDAGAGDVTRNPVTGTVKLAPGALTRLVAGHFAAHPNTALTAGEVGRALARSGGAVRNACDKLVRDGDLRLVSDSPRRYTLSTAAS